MVLVVWSRPSPHEWTSNLMILQYHQCLITLFWVMSEDGKKLSVGCCDVVIKRFSIFRLLLCFDLRTIVIGKVASNRKRISAYRHTPWVNRAQLICVNRRACTNNTGWIPTVRPSVRPELMILSYCILYCTVFHLFTWLVSTTHNHSIWFLVGPDATTAWLQNYDDGTRMYIRGLLTHFTGGRLEYS